MKKLINERLKKIQPKFVFKKHLILGQSNLMFLGSNDFLLLGKLNSKLANSMASSGEENELIRLLNKEFILPDTKNTELLKFGFTKFFLENNTKSLVFSIIPDIKKHLDYEDRRFFLNNYTSSAVSNAIASNSLLNKVNEEKSHAINIFFGDSISFLERKKAINSMILSHYSYSLKSKIKSKKTEAKEKEKEDQNQNESTLTFNFLLDKINSKHIEELKTQIRLGLSTLETRELANTRANIATTDYLANYAKEIISKSSPNKVGIKILEGEDLYKQGYNLIWNVGKASKSKPKIVALEYYGLGKQKPITHAIIGKGLTFDTGGLNLKPGSSMDTMFSDKHGSCNALATFHSVLKLDLKINAVFILGLAENSLDSNSYRPSDIIESKKGLTIEIGNTDAEGRLVLADCFTYVQEKYKPSNIVDIATLTGACKVGLGSSTAGLFSNDDSLIKTLELSSR